ncbi:Uncharacterized protein GBIM_03615 [Gryllus bimaculatus]|nr:Uncharacterized protein GBIM_03615 [Gryllus bimaculatus]
MLCVCAHLVALVLAAAHSGSLISALSAGEQGPPFKSLDEALNHPHSRVVVVVNMSIAIEVVNSKDPNMLLREKLRAEQRRGFPRHVQEALMRSCAHAHTVAMVGQDSVPLLAPGLPCDVTELPFAQLRNPVSFAFARGSPYVGLFSYSARAAAGYADSRPSRCRRRCRPWLNFSHTVASLPRRTTVHNDA